MARRKPQICKVDANQEVIVRGLRAAGYRVQSLAKVGGGAPDLLVGVKRSNALGLWDGESVNLLLEVKMPGKKLNAMEIAWHCQWSGHATIVESLQQALAVCKEAEL